MGMLYFSLFLAKSHDLDLKIEGVTLLCFRIFSTFIFKVHLSPVIKKKQVT